MTFLKFIFSIYRCVVFHFLIIIYYVSSDSVVEFLIDNYQNIAYVYIKNGKFTLYICTLENSGLMEMGFIHVLKCIFCKQLKNI